MFSRVFRTDSHIRSNENHKRSKNLAVHRELGWGHMGTHHNSKPRTSKKRVSPVDAAKKRVSPVDPRSMLSQTNCVTHGLQTTCLPSGPMRVCRTSSPIGRNGTRGRCEGKQRSCVPVRIYYDLDLSYWRGKT